MKRFETSLGRPSWLKKGLIALMVLLVLTVLGCFVFQRWITHTTPTHFAPGPEGDLRHFKYGSIGSDARGIPYRIWQILPEVFADKLPGKGLESIGFIQEIGESTPIGFSKRDGVIPLVGLNCAACHTGSVRVRPEANPIVVPTMPAQQLDLVAYFEFLWSCANDERFVPSVLIPAMGKHGKVTLVERIAYPTVIKKLREGLGMQQRALEYLKTRTPIGPGRVDTFGPYRTLFFHESIAPTAPIGIVDFPAIWLQRILEGHFMQWDGNNDSLDERNLSAALGAGASPETLDLSRINRVRDWIIPLEPPKWPFEQPLPEKVTFGKTIYMAYCASCHDPKGEKFGRVTPLEEVQTDPERVRSFDTQLVLKMNTLGKGYPWRFRHFRSTDGYVNGPLTGIWARAPYLHNGSVPDLHTLLAKGAARGRKIFYRGTDVYDAARVGFVSDQPQVRGRTLVPFDPERVGNSNAGHSYGTELADTEKLALIEFLKTL